MLRRAFTLIELLVVIGILAIIAGIVFPVLAQAREKARAATCVSNARQIGAGVMLYAQDYEEAIVPWATLTGLPYDTARRDATSWVHLLASYVGSGSPPRIEHLPPGAGIGPEGIFRCPSFNPAEFIKSANDPLCDGPNALDPTDLPPRQYFAHYGLVWPAYGAGPHGACTLEDPHSNFPGSDPLIYRVTGTLAQVRRPAATVIVTDGVFFLANDPGYGGGNFWGCEAANSHQGGGTHIFLDSHARWIKGNSQRYLERDAGGCWFWKYYSQDK